MTSATTRSGSNAASDSAMGAARRRDVARRRRTPSGSSLGGGCGIGGGRDAVPFERRQPVRTGAEHGVVTAPGEGGGEPGRGEDVTGVAPGDDGDAHRHMVPHAVCDDTGGTCRYGHGG